MLRFFFCILRRELLLAMRRPAEAVLPLGWFVLCALLFPLGVGPQPALLREIAPGLLWVCALLVCLLSAHSLYGADFADGSLEQLVLAQHPVFALAAAKAASHWLLTGLPLVLAGPAAALMFGVPPAAAGVLFAVLLLGTPVLSLLGGLGAALALEPRGAARLLPLLVLPLAVPVLVFGAVATAAAAAGEPAATPCSLLGATLLLSLVLGPAATTAALHVALQ